MLSVMIFCHDKREGDLIGKICNQCVALIDKEFLRNFIISDEEYHQVNIEGIQPPDLLVVEITGIEDLCRAKRIRGIFPRGRLLVVSTNQISAESYLIPEVSPDMLLLKPYVENVKFFCNIFSKKIFNIVYLLFIIYNDII